MMLRFFRLAGLLLISTLILRSAEAQDQPVVLKLENGAVIRYLRTTTESQTMTMMGRTMETGRKAESELTLKVVGRTELGNYIVELTVDRIHGEQRSPMQPTLIFDTALPESMENADFMTNMSTALAGKTILLTVTPEGLVVSARGYVEALTAAADLAPRNPRINLEQLRAGITETAGISQMQRLIPLLQTAPPSPGASWTSSTDVGVELELRSTIESLDEQMLSLKLLGSFQRDSTIGPEEPGVIKVKVKGSSQISRVDGLFLTSSTTEEQLQKTETSMGVLPVTGTRTTVLKRVDAGSEPTGKDPNKDPGKDPGKDPAKD